MQQRNREIFIIIIKYANYCDLRTMKRGKIFGEREWVRVSQPGESMQMNVLCERWYECESVHHLWHWVVSGGDIVWHDDSNLDICIHNILTWHTNALCYNLDENIVIRLAQWCEENIHLFYYMP